MALYVIYFYGIFYNQRFICIGFALNNYLYVVISFISFINQFAIILGQSIYYAFHFIISFLFSISLIYHQYVIRYTRNAIVPASPIDKCEDEYDSEQINSIDGYSLPPSMIANNVDHDAVMPSMVVADRFQMDKCWITFWSLKNNCLYMTS